MRSRLAAGRHRRYGLSERVKASLAVLLAGLFGWSNACLADEGCSVNGANDIEYLIFWGPYPDDAPDPRDRIGPLAAKLGTTGDGKTRQLGFGPGIPFWVRNEAEIRRAIARAFDTARRTNVAAHFLVDDHIGWEERPDLWNWYDPSKPGYDPDNKRNVEWYDWAGTANKRRYLTPAGVPSQAPHMCYNSRAVEKEISRIVSQTVGPALREGIDKLKVEQKEYLRRDRRSAGKSGRTRGSRPVLQASASKTAHKVVGRSHALASASLAWVKALANPVRASISSNSSGRSTRGRRAMTASRRATRLFGSSICSSPVNN